LRSRTADSYEAELRFSHASQLLQRVCHLAGNQSCSKSNVSVMLNKTVAETGFSNVNNKCVN